MIPVETVKNKIKITVSDLFCVSEALDKLIAQQLEYNVNIAYKIYCMIYRINDATTYILSRLRLVLGDDVKLNSLPPEKQELYNAIMNSEIEIDGLPELTMDDVVDSVGAKLTVSDIAVLDSVFKKVEND